MNLFKFGYKLNFLRNKAAHKDIEFQADVANMLYSHLVVCLYVLGNQISFHRIKQFSRISSAQKFKGTQDLKELINYLELL